MGSRIRIVVNMTYSKLFAIFTVLAILPLCFACKSSPPETGGHHQTGGDSDLDWQGSNTGGSSQTGGNIGGSSQTGSNNGFQVEGPITYDLDVPEAGPNAGDITGGVSSGDRGGCEGFAELKAEETTLFKIEKAPHEDENSKISKITLEQSVRSIARRSAKTLNVQGNCCWQFHEGTRYTKARKIVRNSNEIELSWIPRSLKLIVC